MERARGLFRPMVVSVYHCGDKFVLTFDVGYRSYQKQYHKIRLVERALDTEAWLVKTRAWISGLYLKGFHGAHLAAAGLNVA